MTTWKPGDVAIVLNQWDVWNVAICTLRAEHRGLWWRYGVSDSWDRIEDREARPLVVIDPDDHKQVERLADLFTERHHSSQQSDTASEHGVRSMQAALREFATPRAEVYSHVVIKRHSLDKVAICGKIWRPASEAEVTVAGKCPDCLSIVNDEGWTA